MFGLPSKYEFYKNEFIEKNCVMITDSIYKEDFEYVFKNYDCDKVLVSENDHVILEITSKDLINGDIDQKLKAFQCDEEDFEI